MTNDCESSIGGRELYFHVLNDGKLWRQMGEPNLKKLATQKAKGDYTRKLAIEGVAKYMMVEAAKRYVKEHGGKWNATFTPHDRHCAAELWVRNKFEQAWATGELHRLLPKKYQGVKPSSRREPKEAKLTMAEIKRRNKERAKKTGRAYWFDPGAMRFFNTKVMGGPYAGGYFITRERMDERFPWAYTIRRSLPDGSIDTVGEMRQYETIAAAKAAIPKR